MNTTFFRHHVHITSLAGACLAMLLLTTGCGGSSSSGKKPLLMTSGEAVIAPQGVFSTSPGSTPEPGTVVSMAEWSEGGSMTTFMKGGTPANIGHAQGESPITGRGENVEEGTPIRYFIYNSTPNTVTVKYNVVLQRD